MNYQTLQNDLTLLVNSCDAYEDLWFPFFTLLKKHWNGLNIHIILNTETKQFAFQDLNIECVNYPAGHNYGERMLHALKYVKTKYVLIMLDDFFVRRDVDICKIDKIIQWMEEDAKIVYFNCDCNTIYADWEVNKYDGFRRIPPGNDYTLSLQAAIWRTKSLKKYWMPAVNPWEWETFCNALTTKFPKDKFYTLTSPEKTFLDYGHYKFGDIWGVYRGKWVIEDVGPLFEKEGINIDYSKRGIFTRTSIKEKKYIPTGRKERYARIYKYLGAKETIKFFFYNQLCRLKALQDKPFENDYIQYLLLKVKNNFLKTHK